MLKIIFLWGLLLGSVMTLSATELDTKLANALADKGADFQPRTTHLTKDGKPQYINRLILEDSPYLLQHANNPVNWYPWGAEAFAAAKRENKPIFLSIGYSTCHWCHVMEHESFDNIDVAKLMNQYFISIKVDREQHPDIDATYMTAVTLMTGHGGWPMSSFITHEGKTFWGGTYFPAEQFKQLLLSVHNAWLTQRPDIEKQAESVANAVAQVNNAKRQSAQIDATGTAFESFLEWNYFTGAVVGFLIVLIYIFSGGFVAVAWSDVFQGSIMLFGLVLLPIVAYFSISSEVSISQELLKLEPSFLNIWGEGGLNLINVFTVLGFFFIGLGFMGSPQLFVRFMSIKNTSEIKKGRWVAIVFTIITDSCAVIIGIYGRYLLTSIDANPETILGNGAQNVLPLLVEKIMPLTLIGIYIAAVLSAIMSTIDSLLVLASSAISRDFYQQIFKPNKTETELAKISRIITLVLAVFSLIIAMIVAVAIPGRTIFWFVIFGWSGIAATFCPTIMLSLFWKKFNEKGAIASMITGFLSVPLFKFGVTKIDSIGIYFEKLDVLGPSFFLAIVVGVIVSLITTKKISKSELNMSDIN